MEMNQETLDKMRQMRLLGMYNAFRTSMDSFKVESMTTDQFVSWLVTNEWDERCNRMIERLIKQANFRYKAYMEEMDYSIERGLDRNLLERLAEHIPTIMQIKETTHKLAFVATRSIVSTFCVEKRLNALPFHMGKQVAHLHPKCFGKFFKRKQLASCNSGISRSCNGVRSA